MNTKDIISNWAFITESLSEEERVKKFLVSETEENTVDFDDVEEDEEKSSELSSDASISSDNTISSDTNLSSEQEKVEEADKEKSIDDMTDDELMSKVDSEPSYADVERVMRDVEDKTEMLTKDDYEKLSDEEKMQWHDTAALMDTADDKSFKDDLIKAIEKAGSGKEFVRKHQQFLKDIQRTTDSGMEKQKYTYVFSSEVIYNPSDEKEEMTDAAYQNELKYGDGKNAEERGYKAELATFKPGDFTINKSETRKFTTLEDAKKWVNERVREVCEKYNVTKEDFKVIHIKKVFDYGGHKVEISGIPHEIIDEDPNALGLLCSKTEGEGENVKYGETSFDKVTRTVFFEYIVYQAYNEIVGSTKLDDLAKVMTKKSIEGDVLESCATKESEEEKEKTEIEQTEK